jgi:hypothetical protein
MKQSYFLAIYMFSFLIWNTILIPIRDRWVIWEWIVFNTLYPLHPWSLIFVLSPLSSLLLLNIVPLFTIQYRYMMSLET